MHNKIGVKYSVQLGPYSWMLYSIFQPMESPTKAEFSRAGHPSEMAQHTILVDLNDVLSLTRNGSGNTTLSAWY